MLFRLRKFISVIALLVFLFPVVVEALHTYDHRNDFHCTEHFATHIHAQEHHCAICDYSPAPSDNYVSEIQLTGSINFSEFVFLFFQNQPVEQPKFNFSLRGPPTVS